MLARGTAAVTGTAASGNGAGRRVRVSLREARLVIGRVVTTMGVPLGNVPAVAEFIICAELTGSAALPYVRCEFAALQKDARRPGLPHRSVPPGRLVADGAGRAALLLGPDVADLAVAAASRCGADAVEVADLRDPDFLMALTALDGMPGGRLAAQVSCHEGARTGSCLVTCAAVIPNGNQPAGRPGAALPTCLRRAIDDGIWVGSDLWDWLCEASAAALTPDSPLSRRHTGRL